MLLEKPPGTICSPLQLGGCMSNCERPIGCSDTTRKAPSCGNSGRKPPKTTATPHSALGAFGGFPWLFLVAIITVETFRHEAASLRPTRVRVRFWIVALIIVGHRRGKLFIVTLDLQHLLRSTTQRGSRQHTGRSDQGEESNGLGGCNSAQEQRLPSRLGQATDLRSIIVEPADLCPSPGRTAC
jgi:hypothetical protein